MSSAPDKFVYVNLFYNLIDAKFRIFSKFYNLLKSGMVVGDIRKSGKL